MWRRQRLLLACCLLGFVGCGCAWMGGYSPLRPLERRLVYYPAVYPVGEWNKPTADTEDVGFFAADGTRLHGWFLPHERPRGVALICHGNGGNITSYRESLVRLNEENQLSVMSFDYRGYGKSAGVPSEEGLLQDARAARDWLAKRTGVPIEDVILFGYSLGGAVAVDLAQDGARGLVLWSTFSTLPETASAHYRWLPTGALMTERFDSVSKLRRYNGPLLQSHGDQDEIIPIELGERLHAAHSGPKRFIRIPGANHSNADSPSYRRELATFLDEL